MKNSQELIEQSFKALLEATPYDKITVRSICEMAGVSRKTFYANYDNKDAIIESIFMRTVIAPMESLRSLITGTDLVVDRDPNTEVQDLASIVTERLYQSLYDERAFFKNVVINEMWPETAFVKLVTSSIFKLNLRIFDELGFKGSAPEKEYSAYYHAAAQAMIVQKWIRDGMPIPAKAFSELYIKWTMGYWYSLIE
ncbi:MAG: TetR/AcrR family transcriptional regulator [Eggerthellaceae bacterium]|nr:TetR/AcrR family transcriptional regulator [Eggerthellaceae bacterium]MDR2716276.1 TetR/AcrR family transcriptional regulator [Coriobacteriaceae bacterium]